MEDPEIVTFQDGKYTNEVRETIFELAGMGISMNKVNDVIKTVLQNMTSKNVGRLPSKSLKSRLVTEANCLAKIHLCEQMTKCADPSSNTGNCLHGDGTTKFHRHYQNFQITLLNGETMSMGLREIGASDHGTIFQTFVKLIDELKDALPLVDDTEKQNLVAKLVTSIKNTMSDQGSVNPCFNRQLQIFRESLLPDVLSNWEELSDNSKLEISSMGNFFCKMHLLINFATEANNMLREFEQIACSNESPNSIRQNESGAARLIRTACKAFHPRGSDEAGVASHFQAFLTGKNCTSKFISFVGNRVNVLFYNAAATYFHLEHVTEFLDKWPNQNRLLQAVSEDSQNKVYIAGVRALGIIDKIITGPYWRLIEETKSILDLNRYLLKMKTSLENWANDASTLFAGEEMFDDVMIHNDALFDKIFADSGDVELDSLTQQALEILMNGLLILLERQAQDQLPGGKYFETDPVTSKSASNVPTTNKVSESDFAILDMLVRQKPSATILHHEMITMWLRNKTAAWLNSKSNVEKAHLLELAKSNTEKAIKLYKIRSTEIKSKRLEILHQKQQSKQDSLERERVSLVNLTQKLGQCGNLWTSLEDVNFHLERLRTNPKELYAALKTQIQFQKNVLKSKGDKQLFQMSEIKNEKRVQFDNKRLTENLKKIIELNPPEVDTDENTTSEISHIIPENVRTTAVNELKSKLVDKLKESRMKRIIDAQKTKLPAFLQAPEKLTGCKIKHKCFVDAAKTSSMWYDAEVLGIKKAHVNPIKTEYLVKYDEDDDDDDQWFFPLLTDLKNGDLIIKD